MAKSPMKFICSELLDNSTNKVRTGRKHREDNALPPCEILFAAANKKYETFARQLDRTC